MPKKRATPAKRGAVAKTPANRSPGSPRVKTLTARQHQTIIDRICQQATFAEVGAELGLTESAVRQHWQSHIAPVLRSGAFRSAEFQLAKLDAIEREAWRQFRGEGTAETQETVEKLLSTGKEDRKLVREMKKAVKTTGAAGWLTIILAVWDRRCQLLGVNSRVLRLVDDGGSELYRVAGADPNQIDDAMVSQLMTVLEDIRSVRQARNNHDALTIDQASPPKK